MKQPSIEKIVFDIRGKKIELTKDEAQELKSILADLFGETKVVHEHHTHTWPYYHWSTPSPLPYWSPSPISYSAIGNSSGILSNATTDTAYLTLQG